MSKLLLTKLQRLIDKEKFILVLGDDGLVLVHIRKNILQNRLFFKHSSEEDANKLKDIIAIYPKVPIQILIDTIDQSYVAHSLPGVSMFSINKLVKKRLERDFGANDLKNSFLINRLKTGRNDWNFMFVAVSYSAVIQEWLNIIFKLPNPLTGIYTLPIETGNVVKQLNQVFLSHKVTQDKKNHISEWQIFVCHNKVGGFRQVAFRNGKVMFTRLITSGVGESPDFVVGSIEQEIQNSVEYLKRLSLNEEAGYDIYFIVSQEIKNKLVKVNFKSTNNNIILTPYELSEKLNLIDVCKPEDKFADVLIAASFAQNRPILPLKNDVLNKILLLEIINRMIFLPALALPVILFSLVNNQINIISANKDLKFSKEEKFKVEERWNAIQKNNNMDIETANKIIDIVSLNRVLNTNLLSPISLISSFAKAKTSNVLLKSANFRNIASRNDNNVIRGVFNIEFYNNGKGYQDLFDDFDIFIKSLEKTFSGYNISYSRITERISFSNEEKIIPVQINLESAK